MAQATWLRKPVLLDRVKHRAWRVRTAGSWGFASEAHAIAIAGAEFNEACKEYAIVFAQLEGRVTPVVLLGLRAGQNLFVDDSGSWDARYIPASVRRHPFVLAQLPGQSLAACIDEASPAVGEGEGEALFDAQGAETPFLRHALEFLANYQREHARTEPFCRRLDEAGLLKSMNARANLTDGRTFTVDGMLVVDEQKLLALPDATVLSMFRAGELHWVSLHLASLSNLQRLVDRMAQRPSPLQPPPLPQA